MKRTTIKTYSRKPRGFNRLTYALTQEVIALQRENKKLKQQVDHKFHIEMALREENLTLLRKRRPRPNKTEPSRPIPVNEPVAPLVHEQTGFDMAQFHRGMRNDRRINRGIVAFAAALLLIIGYNSYVLWQYRSSTPSPTQSIPLSAVATPSGAYLYSMGHPKEETTAETTKKVDKPTPWVPDTTGMTPDQKAQVAWEKYLYDTRDQRSKSTF